MKRIFFILAIALIFLTSFSAFGQNEKSVREQIQTEKIAFFTEKIGLTLEEAEKFWPIYNAYWNKKNELIRKRKERMSYYLKHSESMSDQELRQLADEYVNYRLQKAQLLNEYHQKFKKILPIEKVMRIYMADYDFKSYLLKKLKNTGEKERNQ